jgi:DNA-binding transcriptional LysR family regulator
LIAIDEPIELVARDALESLRSGELDILLSVGLVRDSALRVRTLGEIDACLVMPATMSSRLPRRKHVSIKQLALYECVAYGKIGDPFFDAVWAFLEDADLVRNVRIEVPNIQAIKQLVLEGGGVSILPRYTIVESTLAIRELRGLDVRLPLCAITRPRGDQSPIVRELLRELSANLSVTKRKT